MASANKIIKPKRVIEASPMPAKAHVLNGLARLVFHTGSGEEARAAFKTFLREDHAQQAGAFQETGQQLLKEALG